MTDDHIGVGRHFGSFPRRTDRSTRTRAPLAAVSRIASGGPAQLSVLAGIEGLARQDALRDLLADRTPEERSEFARLLTRFNETIAESGQEKR